jgi:hypothetical protein
MALHYDYYTVLSSRCTLIAANGTSGSLPFAVVLLPAYTVPSSALKQYVAQPFAVAGVVSNTATSLTLTGTATTTRIMGVSALQVRDNPEYSALVSANPARQWYWNVAIQSLDATSNNTADCLIAIEYTVEFFERVSANLDTLVAAKFSMLGSQGDHKGEHKAFSGELNPVNKQLSETEIESRTRAAALGDKSRSVGDVKDAPVAWGDLSEDDEADFAEFMAWKRRTGPQPLQERTAGGLLGPDTSFRAPTSTVAGTSGGSTATPTSRMMLVPPKDRAGVG